MTILEWGYEKLTQHPAPYYYKYSLLTIIKKTLRKWITNSITPRCPFNCIRILLYRLCGFKIGKHTFIGMHCYLDDMCYDLLTIGNDVIISYGVYFACHGKNQEHYPIKVEDGAYIGMRACIISKNSNLMSGGGGGNIREKCQKLCLCFDQQRYSGCCYSSWNPLQDNHKRLANHSIKSAISTGKEVLIA